MNFKTILEWLLGFVLVQETKEVHAKNFEVTLFFKDFS